jgi:D-sedoheptulose 7-phosphate isomerase
MNPSSLVSHYLDEVVSLLQSVEQSAVVEVAEVLRRICRSGGTVFVCGNGGSASTASHMACDLSKNVVTTDHGRLRVVSLNDNLAHFSAIANDLDYSEVFVEQLRNLMTDRDALLAISASGNSPNVVKAARFVRDLGAPVVGFTGFNGGELGKLASPVLHVPSDNYGPVEDLHLVFNHLLVVVLRALLSE